MHLSHLKNFRPGRYLLFSLLAFVNFVSCKKYDEQDLYSKSGIWKIDKLQIDYLNNAGKQDSSRTFSDCGYIVFSNVKNVAATESLETTVYSGSSGQTRYGVEQHYDFWYYTKDNQIVTGWGSGYYITYGAVYEIVSPGADRNIWLVKGTTKTETYQVHKLKYDEEY